MKKGTLAILLGVLALALLCACGGGKSEPSRGVPVEDELRLETPAAGSEEQGAEPAPSEPAAKVSAPDKPEPEDAPETQDGEPLPIAVEGETAGGEDTERAADREDGENGEEPPQEGDFKYVLNTNTKKIHNPWCSSVQRISPKNYQETNKSIEELEAEGYVKCGQNGDWK